MCSHFIHFLCETWILLDSPGLIGLCSIHFCAQRTCASRIELTKLITRPCSQNWSTESNSVKMTRNGSNKHMIFFKTWREYFCLMQVDEHPGNPKNAWQTLPGSLPRCESHHIVGIMLTEFVTAVLLRKFRQDDNDLAKIQSKSKCRPWKEGCGRMLLGILTVLYFIRM